MPKITSVEPQKKNPHRFNIFLDNKFAFGADEDLVVEKRLVIGKSIGTSEVEYLLFEAEVGKLMERMYRLFNIRQRSEKEIRDYFKIMNYELKFMGKEQISDLAIGLVIKKLKQKELLNDEEFARAWVTARRKNKQKGIKAIKAELYQKGIAKDLIEEITGEITPKSEQQLARQALVKRWPRWKNLSEAEKKKKAYEFLSRRGFEYEAFEDVIEKIIEKV